jgi:hypothetical protein
MPREIALFDALIPTLLLLFIGCLFLQIAIDWGVPPSAPVALCLASQPVSDRVVLLYFWQCRAAVTGQLRSINVN